MASSKLTRVPLQSIVVRRDDKNVTPEIGKAFEFTEQEISELEAMNKDNPRPLFRKMIQEEAPEPTAPSPKAADAKGTDAKGTKAADAKGTKAAASDAADL